MNSGAPRLGFIGIGLMGAPMTRRLLDAGYAVTVWNRSREKILPVLEAGAQEADGPAAVAAAAEIVMMCLTDAGAVENVVFGDHGVAEHGTPDKVLIDFSSMRPDFTRDYAARLKAQTGMAWIDAPVSGGTRGAEAGTLAILAGGDAADVERVRPVVANLCQRFTHMGPSGAGQVAKLCNQMIVGSAMAAIAEAVALAEKSGVEAEKLPEALAGGFADSQVFQIFGPRFARRQTEPFLGHVFTMLKDLDSARLLGEEKSSPMPMTAAAAEFLRQASLAGLAEADISAIMTLFDPA